MADGLEYINLIIDSYNNHKQINSDLFKLRAIGVWAYVYKQTSLAEVGNSVHCMIDIFTWKLNR